MKRLFVGFEVSKAVHHQLAEWVFHQKTPDKVKWVDPSNYHITLAFLGETSEETLPYVEKTLKSLARQYAAATLHFSHLAKKPSKQPHLYWAQWSVPTDIKRLQQDTMQSLINPDYVENREWLAHTTLARFRQEPRNIQLAVDWQLSMRVEKLILFESKLHPKGAQYTQLKSFSLQK